MIDTETLRKKVIDLAIQGKLTQQLPEDGNAEDLYTQIQEERVKLIKEGKIKQEKPLPEISDDEIPFEIPSNWKWMRLIDVAVIINGDRGKNYPAKSSLSRSGTIPFISALNLNGKSVSEDENLLYLSEKQYDALGSGKLIKNDIVVCIRGSLGKHGRYPYDTGAIASSLVICRAICFPNEMGDYIMRWLDSSMFPKEIDKYDGGSAQPNLAAENLKKFLIPIPPIEEQKRIVNVIDDIFDQLDIIDILQKQYESDREVLKGKIIDAGIRGKLTEQLTEDGNAEDLYAQIQEEKAKLIKEGKIKKEKQLPEISDDEIPFEIPSNWKWIRFRDLGVFGGGKTPSMNNSDYWSNGIMPWITSKDMKQKYLSSSQMLISECAAKTMTVYPPNSVLFVVRSGILKRMLPVAIAVENTTINQDLKALRLYIPEMCEYVYYVLKSFEYIILYKYSKEGTTVNNINFDHLLSMPIPLPPLKEQKRIEAILEEIAISERSS